MVRRAKKPVLRPVKKKSRGHVPVPAMGARTSGRNQLSKRKIASATVAGASPGSRSPRNAVKAPKDLAIGDENIFGTDINRRPAPVAAEGFDEARYLELNPDVRLAIELGQFESGYSHYVSYGYSEGRQFSDTLDETVMETQPQSNAEEANVGFVQMSFSIESVLIAAGSGLMIVGWIDDIIHPITSISITSPGWRTVIDKSRLVRMRRLDVEKAKGGQTAHSFGFFCFELLGKDKVISEPITVELSQEAEIKTTLECSPIVVGDIELRNAALARLASASFFGNPAMESMNYLGSGVGRDLIRLNKTITRRFTTTPYIVRFGDQKTKTRGTIVICLYGKAEFYFVQSCLFSGLPGIGDYEFIFVSNSPELTETLLREAESASLIYGLSNTVMILSGNAGFAGANNAAVRIARSSRLLFINPDVFPRESAWAKQHTDLLDSAAPEQTQLIGVPLYYDNGSLMHGGMYFEIDKGLIMARGVPTEQRICRVEHYGKGAPPDTPQFTQPRAVPAVTGAFISIDKKWFEQLGGFSEEFIFGHYEDADLCLRSIVKGVAPWVHNISMWHLEGKGSTRQLAHEGGSLVNRWLFSRTWLDVISAGLNGPTPELALTSSSLASLRRSALARAAPVRARLGRGRRMPE